MASERDTPEHHERRRQFFEVLALTNAKRFVFLDESFCRTGMRREHAWSARGERVHASKPGRTWQTLTLIGAVRLGQRPKLMTHHGPVNGRVFVHFVKRRLAPWLRRGDIVVMDNLGAHKTPAVREAIEAAGAIPIYLPTYSPELNPIELWWAHLKRDLRYLRVDLRDELARVVRRLRASLPIEHITAWFRCAANHSQFK